MTRAELFEKVARVKAAKNLICNAVDDETAIAAK